MASNSLLLPGYKEKEENELGGKDMLTRERNSVCLLNSQYGAHACKSPAVKDFLNAFASKDRKRSRNRKDSSYLLVGFFHCLTIRSFTWYSLSPFLSDKQSISFLFFQYHPTSLHLSSASIIIILMTLLKRVNSQ